MKVVESIANNPFLITQDLENRVNNAVEAFMESVDHLLAKEDQPFNRWDFTKQIDPAQWIEPICVVN